LGTIHQRDRHTDSHVAIANAAPRQYASGGKETGKDYRIIALNIDKVIALIINNSFAYLYIPGNRDAVRGNM